MGWQRRVARRCAQLASASVGATRAHVRPAASACACWRLEGRDALVQHGITVGW